MILIVGQGGIGKTHLLCDIVNGYCKRMLPAGLLLGDMFGRNTAADDVIMNWEHPGGKIEQYFAWLDAYGEESDVYIPICIDASMRQKIPITGTETFRCFRQKWENTEI